MSPGSTDPQGREGQLAQGNAGAGLPRPAAHSPRSDDRQSTLAGTAEGPSVGTATGGSSEGTAGVASGAAPMEIVGATHETSARQSERAAREAAAMEERKQMILLAIREHVEAEYGSEMAAEFEFKFRTPEEMAASALEAAFREAGAGVLALAEEKARDQSSNRELKELLRTTEAYRAAAIEGLADQQLEQERLANETLKTKGSAGRSKTTVAMLRAQSRQVEADCERLVLKCNALEAARRPAQRTPAAWRRGPPPVPSPTLFATTEMAQQLWEKHAAPKYVDEDAPLWIVTVQGKNAGASRTKFRKALDVHLHHHGLKKFVLRSANVAQFAVHPVWWGVAMEAARLCGWTTIADIPPWDPAPEEELSPVEARTKGLELWGTALAVEEPRVQQLAAWVRSRAPSETELTSDIEEDPRPVLPLQLQEDGGIVECPDWADEEMAPLAEKQDREPEPQLQPQLGPVPDDDQPPPPPPEARRALQIKRHRIKEGERPVEMDGTLGDEMVLIEVPDGCHTGSSDEENTPRAKRAGKKAAPEAAAAPAQAEAAGPPSTETARGSGPGGPSTAPSVSLPGPGGELQALVPVRPTSPPTELPMAHEWAATGNFAGGEEEAPMRPAEWRALQSFEPAWRERDEQGQSLIMATVNANGLPRETAAEEISNVMAGLPMNILAIQETKLLEESAEHLRKTLAADKWFSRFSSAAVDEQHRQKGVAVVLDPLLALHFLKCEEVRVDGPGEQPPTGTGLRLELRFRRQRVLQLIVVYIPPGSENREVRDRTQQVVQQWLDDAAAANQQAVLLGDFNERIIADGPSSELGRIVANPERWVEAHQSIHGDRGGETALLRNGTQRGCIDLIFATTGLGPGFVQAAVMESQSGLGEDRRLVVAELAMVLLEQGQQQLQLRAAFQRAGKLEYQLFHRCNGRTGRRRAWGALVVECHELLPDGLPAEILQECAELAEGDPPAGWQTRMRLLTVYIHRRLTRLRRYMSYTHL